MIIKDLQIYSNMKTIQLQVKDQGDYMEGIATINGYSAKESAMSINQLKEVLGAHLEEENEVHNGQYKFEVTFT